MRCHYEVLGVPRDADDSDLKKSYRKLALKNHPDKHPENVEEYTKVFREIQSAYDVLSDKQERAFYDKHREAILRGGEDFVDDALDLMQYFNTSVYSGYNDEPDGFYAVFEKVFRTVADEEEAYLEGESADEYLVPEFGTSTSDYDSTVAPFYAFWLSYCTRKSFVWKDKYDIRQAPNRPTQRLMEKENKKIRDVFKRKRNEEVRALVQFIRKRDPRVKANRKKIEAAKQESKLKMEQKRKDDIRKRNKGLDKYKEQDWMLLDSDRLDDIDAHFDENFGGGEASQLEVVSDGDKVSDYDQEMVDEFYCIACEKTFKSEKALSNHEKSKKHKENVQLIKNEMEEEFANEFEVNNVQATDDSVRQHEEMIHRVDSLMLTENVIRRNVIVHTTSPRESNILENSILTHSTDSLEYTKQKGILRENSAKIKDRKKMKRHNLEGIMGLEAVLGDSPLTDSIYVHRQRKGGKGQNGKKLMEIDSIDNDDDVDSDCKEGSSDLCETVTEVGSEEMIQDIEDDKDDKASKPAAEKRKPRRNKGPKSVDKKIVEENDDENFICGVCAYEFPSRNKLFTHIKTEGHAQLKDAKGNKIKGKTKSKR